MTEISFFSFSLSAYKKLNILNYYFLLFLPEKKFRIWIDFLENQFFKFLTGKNPKINNLIHQFLDYQMILIQFFHLDHKHFINECFEVWVANYCESFTSLPKSSIEKILKSLCQNYSMFWSLKGQGFWSLCQNESRCYVRLDFLRQFKSD